MKVEFSKKSTEEVLIKNDFADLESIVKKRNVEC